MGFKTRRSKSHQGNDHAKKSKLVHGEPSSTSPSDDAVPMDADEQMMAMFDLGEDGVVKAVTTDEVNVIGKQSTCDGIAGRSMKARTRRASFQAAPRLIRVTSRSAARAPHNSLWCARRRANSASRTTRPRWGLRRLTRAGSAPRSRVPCVRS